MLTRSLAMIATMAAFAPVSTLGLQPGDLPGLCFRLDDPGGGAPPATPPAATPPATPPTPAPTATPAPGTPPPTTPPAATPPATPPGEDWKAKYEALAAEDQKRKDAELTETQREKKRADTAEAAAKTAQADLLKVKIGNELGIPADAIDFITATDEASIRAQAEKLKTFVKAPAAGGTVTNPAGGQQPSLEQQIADAEKSGNTLLAITLKRQQAFAPKS